MGAVVHHLRAAGRDGPRRELASYRTYALGATASLNAAGQMIVQATLRGGPERAQFEFPMLSEEGDAAAACEAALCELRTLVDQLWLGPVNSQAAFGR